MRIIGEGLKELKSKLVEISEEGIAIASGLEL